MNNKRTHNRSIYSFRKEKKNGGLLIIMLRETKLASNFFVVLGRLFLKKNRN